QSGSAFKPFVLATALDEGIATSQTFVSKPVVIAQGGDFWSVHNYEGAYQGRINLEQATVFSDNSVYAQLTAHAGPARVAQVANDLGIGRELDPFLSIGLGTDAVSPLDMARAYATFATGGGRVDGKLLGNVPRAVLAVQDGDELQTNDAVRTRVLDQNDAAILTSILQKVVREGTGRRARLSGYAAAGKTGTTENFGDAWFVGYTPQISVAVWVGYPDELRPMLSEFDGKPVAGGTFPALIWKSFVEKALAEMGEPRRPFRQPHYQSTKQVRVVSRNGEWLRDNGRCTNTRTVVYYSDKTPDRVAPCKRNEVEVPDLIGERLVTAETRLAQQPLQPDLLSRVAEPGEKLGVVVDQFPKRGTLSSYDTVRLVVAKATEGVVPNVVGLPLLEAQDLLVKRRLQPVAAGEGEGQAGVVVSQSPSPRVAAAPGMQVELIVGGSSPDAAKSPRG
ncbi:MAG: penicillin-binding transpeptidase domain-containing protein, partial [Gaiellales bacterium]